MELDNLGLDSFGSAGLLDDLGGLDGDAPAPAKNKDKNPEPKTVKRTPIFHVMAVRGSIPRAMHANNLLRIGKQVVTVKDGHIRNFFVCEGKL